MAPSCPDNRSTWPPASILVHPHIAIRVLSCGPAVAPLHTLVHAAFADWATRQPDAVAAIHGDESITYAALERAADALAHRLQRSGIGSGDTVGLFVTRSIPMLVAIIASLKIGAAYVPQDIRIAPPALLSQMLEAAGCRALLCLAADRAAASRLQAREVLVIEESIGDTVPSDWRPPPVSSDGTAFILYTSGTTGMPNGVPVTHRNLCNVLLTPPGNLGIRPSMQVSQLLNIAFDLSAWEILGTLCQGATLIIRGENMQAAAAEADVIIATPSILSRLQRDQCRRVQTVAVAGEPCPEALALHWSERCAFHNGCGPTETTIVNTLHRHEAGGRPLSIGAPMPNNAVYVLDPHQQPCAVGQVGEMWAGGVGVTAGYLSNPALTAERFQDDPFLGDGWQMFRTRDLGRWNAHGELEHLGRTDDQVKVRGFRVELDAVSRIVEGAAGVRQAVTLQLDTRTLACVVTPANADVDHARDHARRQLPYYAVPEQMLALDALPLTSRGKVDKRRLMHLLGSHTAGKPPTGAATSSRTRGSISHYTLLFMMVIAANASVAAYLMQPAGWASLTDAPETVAGLALGNLSMAILMRQSLVINALFRLACCAPVAWPLDIRRHLAKVYHFGGLHSGGASAGVAWMLVFAAIGFSRGDGGPVRGAALSWTVFMLLAVLLAMLATALPVVRRRHHDVFEKVHRYAGWTTLLLSWALALQMRAAPMFVLLGLVTVSVALPWLRLRRVPVQVEVCSAHAAILTVSMRPPPFTGSANAISRSPLGQWHSFANIPAPGKHRSRMIISRAGDWTGRFIDDPPRHLWMRGFTTAGVAYIEVLFHSVLYVATGSGIGPVLPHLLARKVRMRLIWSVRSPRVTYGDALVDEILAAQPDALIWDTHTAGKPELLQLAWQTAQHMNAEAVICIANRALTDAVVDGCEARGLPAYGAIWDS